MALPLPSAKPLCPRCGTDKMLTRHESRHASLYQGSDFTYLSVLNVCIHCHYAGDFFNLNEKLYFEAKLKAAKIMQRTIIENVLRSGFTAQSLEEIFNLDAGSVECWYSGEVTKESLEFFEYLAKERLGAESRGEA